MRLALVDAQEEGRYSSLAQPKLLSLWAYKELFWWRFQELHLDTCLSQVLEDAWT